MQKGIIKNVNKLTGEAIDAKDLASMLSGIIGNESGVLTVFDELRLEKISNNKVRLHSGVYSLKGHILYIPKGSYEDFTIDSGTLGANRIDLLVAEYVKNGEGDGEDTLRFRVIKGELSSGQPQAPDLIQQGINANGITRQEILYEIKVQNTELSISERKAKIRNLEQLKKYSDDLDTKLTKEINRLSENVHVVDVVWISGLEAYMKLSDGTMLSWGRIWGETNDGGELQGYLGGKGHWKSAPILDVTARRNARTPCWPRVRSVNSEGWFAVEFFTDKGDLFVRGDAAFAYIAIGRWK